MNAEPIKLGLSQNERVVIVVRDITERKRAEEALRKNELKLAEILNTINDGVWSISWPDMKILYLSPSIESIYGYSTEEFIEKPGLWQNITHPDDRLFMENNMPSKTATKAQYVFLLIKLRTW